MDASTQDRALDPTVVRCVAARAGRDPESIVGDTELGEDLGLDDAAVITVLAELKAAGYEVRDGVDLGRLTTVRTLDAGVRRAGTAA
ncbi:phosphopantetheine-binding protein (plasmid) [Streptomyces sp. BI20]|uniref:phosphopantetheine-binding protein n=1 Tax=Streptomyces sp. BI20 TaxID=3403460 RepID=UPI003C780B4F